MNNKIIAAGVVVALCAVALIGVGYAYTATVVSNGNAIGSDYITIKAGTGVESIWALSGNEDGKQDNFEYNTTTTGAGQYTFESLSTFVGGKSITVSSNGNTVSSVTVTMSFSISSLDSTAQNLFYQKDASDNESFAEVKLGGVSANSSSYSGGVVTYTFSSVSLDAAKEVSIAPISGVQFVNATSVPAISLLITFVAST